jgi:hypothetical protein
VQQCLVWDVVEFEWVAIRVVLNVLWFVLGVLGLLLGGNQFKFEYGNDALCSVLPFGCILVCI